MKHQIDIVPNNTIYIEMSDRLLKESDVLRIAFQLPCVVNSAFFEAVKALPSAERLQERWELDPINKNIMYCSNCKVSYTKDFLRGMSLYYEPKDTPNFCPNCGADMRMKGADNE